MYAWGIGGSDLFEFEILFLAFQSYCWRHDPSTTQKVHVAVFTYVALMWARAEHSLCHICYLLRLLTIPPFSSTVFLIICICENPKFFQIGRSLKFQPPWCLHDNNFSAFSSNPSISTSPGIGDSLYLPWWGHLGGGLALHPPCCCPGSPLLNTTEHLAVGTLWHPKF